MLDVRVAVQVKPASDWVDVLQEVVGHEDYLSWVLTNVGRPSYLAIASQRWLPVDSEPVQDVNAFYTNSVPGFPPFAYSQHFQATNLPAGFFLGDHGFSWLTLAELLAYDWNGKWVYPIDVDAGKTPIKVAKAACAKFHDEFIPRLQALAVQYGVSNENLRIIIGLYNH